MDTISTSTVAMVEKSKEFFWIALILDRLHQLSLKFPILHLLLLPGFLRVSCCFQIWAVVRFVNKVIL